jgi:hypothetical protein
MIARGLNVAEQPLQTKAAIEPTSSGLFWVEYTAGAEPCFVKKAKHLTLQL